MKKLYLVILLCGKVYSMEPAANEIATKIASIIEQYDSTTRADDSEFKTLVTSYFTRESKELEGHVMPLFSQKLKDKDGQIAELIKLEDKDKLESFISGLITESLEEAFQNQSDRYAELKALADSNLNKARYALITAIITSLLSIGGTLAGFWFRG